MNRIGLALARFLEKPVSHAPPFEAVDPATLQASLRPGDVLLVEGTSRISLAIKYLTQSSWSHSALYVGDALRGKRSGAPAGALIEADLRRGVIAVPLAKYAVYNTRICRPVGLTPEVSSAFSRGTKTGEIFIKELQHIRHYSLFTPRDFDVSPYFQIVKPTIEKNFDYRTLLWEGQAQPLDSN